MPRSVLMNFEQKALDLSILLRAGELSVGMGRDFLLVQGEFGKIIYSYRVELCFLSV